MKAQRKALEEERFKVLEISRRIGKRFGPISVIFGACLLIISFFLTITNTVLTVLVASSPEIKVFFIVFSVFLGIVNAVTGLLLMGCD